MLIAKPLGQRVRMIGFSAGFRRAVGAALAGLALIAPVAARAASSWTVAHTTARLVSEYDRVDGQGPFWVMVELDIQPGWHTYWKNPGDSGLATALTWTLPPGVKASDIAWQPPRRILAEGLVNYGYVGKAYHLVRITPPPGGYKGASLPLKVETNWLVCEQECLPERATLDLAVPVGAHATPSGAAGRIHDLAGAAKREVLALRSSSSDRDHLQLALPARTLPQPTAVYFYPDVNGLIEPAAPQTFMLKDGVLTLTLKRGAVDVPKQVSGLLEIDQGKGPVRYVDVVASS